MKTQVTKGLIAVVCGLTALPIGTARANDIEDFFKRAHNSLMKRQGEIIGAHVAAASVAAALAPRGVNVRVRTAPQEVRIPAVPREVRIQPGPSRQHVCRQMQVRVWVEGYWANTIEQRYVPYSHGGGGYYEDVVVKRWVPGYYQLRLQPDPNCWCQRMNYNSYVPLHGGTYVHPRPPQHDHNRHDRRHHGDRHGNRDGHRR